MAEERQYQLLGESITDTFIQGSHSGQSKPGLDNADAATIIGVNNTSHASRRCAPREVTFFGAA